MIRPLIWKEWHEQRWKLVFGSLVLMGYTAIALRSRLLPDEYMIVMMCIWGAPLLPVFVVMDLFSVEREGHTLERLLSLPVRTRQVFAVKLVVGAVVCIFPMTGSMLVSLLIAGGREMTARQIIMPYLCSMVFTQTMFIWSASIGVSQPSESRAALVSLVIFIVWGAIVVIAEHVITHPFDRWSLVVTPFGFFEVGLDHDYSLLPKIIPVQLLAAICLIMWGARRFSRLEKTKV
jgi:hypothetical protein